MAGIHALGWLYTRGAQSVRLVRAENSEGCRLFLYGPGTDIVTHDFADVTDCMKQQADIERRLASAGYRLVQPADRRSGNEMWSGTQRRSNDSIGVGLFWSKRGEVACQAHAPTFDAHRWQAEGWCAIPEAARRQRLPYQCPRCAADGRMHRHAHRPEGPAIRVARSA